MKNRIKSFLPLIVSITGILFHSSCNSHKCPDNQTETFSLNSASLSKIPYHDFDTLKFLDINGDTNILVGDRMQSYFNTTLSGSSMDCSNNITKNYQTSKINFSPIKGNLKFSVFEETRNAYLSVSVKQYPITFSQYYSGLFNPGYDLFDSIKFNNKYYYKVEKLMSINNNGQVTSQYQLFYNVPCGVLSIKDSVDNEEYTILP